MQSLALLVGISRSLADSSYEPLLATASYRFLPHIKITKPIPPHLAEEFQKCFSPGVIRIDPRTKEATVDPQGVRKDSVTREVFRHPEFAESVELSRVRDYILCKMSIIIPSYYHSHIDS